MGKLLKLNLLNCKITLNRAKIKNKNSKGLFMPTPPTSMVIDNYDELLYTIGRDHKILPSPLYNLIPENKITGILHKFIKSITRLIKIDNTEINKILEGYAKGREISREDIIFYLMLVDLINYNIDEYIDINRIVTEQYSIFSYQDDKTLTQYIHESKNAKIKSKDTTIYSLKKGAYQIDFLNLGQFPLDFNFAKNSQGISFTFHKQNNGKINLKGKPHFIFKYEMITQVDSVKAAEIYLSNLETFSSWTIYLFFPSGQLLIFNTYDNSKQSIQLSNNDFQYFYTENNPQIIDIKNVKEIISFKDDVNKYTSKEIIKSKIININTSIIGIIYDKLTFLDQNNISQSLKNKHLILANEANHKSNKSELYHHLQMYLAENKNCQVEFLLYSLFYQDHRNQNELNSIDKLISRLKDKKINKNNYNLLKELITIDLGHNVTSQKSIINLYREQNKLVRMAIRKLFKINLQTFEIEFPSIDLLYKLNILS